MLEAIQSNSLPVALINRFGHKDGLGPGEVILTAMLTDLAQFFNLGKSFTGTQLGMTVELILTDPLAKNLKPEDFRVIFNNAKKGLYGTIYNRLDGQVVFEWIRAYTAERIEYCEQNSIQLHENLKRADNLIHPEVAAMYKEILKNMEREKPAAIITQDPREKPKRVKSPRDQFIQDRFVEFDKLAKIEVKGKRFVAYQGKTLDDVEFVTEKVKEYDELIAAGKELEL